MDPNEYVHGFPDEIAEFPELTEEIEELIYGLADHHNSPVVRGAFRVLGIVDEIVNPTEFYDSELKVPDFPTGEEILEMNEQFQRYQELEAHVESIVPNPRPQ